MTDTRIETFLTLCRVMNYRKTAEELNMTQPAVTQHIHYLENYYNCRLFIYDRKSLRMTPEAEMLKKYAENVSCQEKRLKALLSEKSGCHLSIGATKTIGEYVISEHICAFLGDSANRISVNVDNTERLLEALSRGEIDFAIIEGYFDSSRYASRLYRKEPFVGICGERHPFAGRVVSSEDVLNEELILREEGSGTREILRQLLAGENISFSRFPRITSVSSFGLAARILEKGMGISFAYRAVREQEKGLAEFMVRGWDIVREFNYVYLDNPFSEQAVEIFDSYRMI
ncbi:MAG: LysR family transcriptional regulator [Oscillospiraceae bacterium]|nr:LysR family transcriptional regulator [Oscillospiraceae bacterium]